MQPSPGAPPGSVPRVMTLAQWAGGASWGLELQHSEAAHALIWQTRGQGRCVIEGVRRGISVHTALAIPAGTMFSLELGKQSFGLVCLLPPLGDLPMPDTPTILRIRDVQSQAEVTGIFEALQREQNMARPFLDEALRAQGALLTVWLRRAMIENAPAEEKPSAAIRLVQAYAALLERDYMTGRSMADYAHRLGVTPTHLTRVCRECSGQTAAALLTERCLHAARTAIERGERPITEVAAALGFSSGAYFSRFILHHTGSSPSALRRSAAMRPPKPGGGPDDKPPGAADHTASSSSGLRQGLVASRSRR